MDARHEMASLAASVTGTILASVIWFAFIVLYLAFYAGGMDFWQKTAVFLASGAIVAELIGVFWSRYGLKGVRPAC